MWLYNLLPRYIPNARIMLFGYKSPYTRSMSGEDGDGCGEGDGVLSAEGLARAAEALFEALEEKREGLEMVSWICILRRDGMDVVGKKERKEGRDIID